MNFSLYQTSSYNWIQRLFFGWGIREPFISDGVCGSGRFVSKNKKISKRRKKVSRINNSQILLSVDFSYKGIASKKHHSQGFENSQHLFIRKWNQTWRHERFENSEKLLRRNLNRNSLLRIAWSLERWILLNQNWHLEFRLCLVWNVHVKASFSGKLNGWAL